jgi:hypothetical protein
MGNVRIGNGDDLAEAALLVVRLRIPIPNSNIPHFAKFPSRKQFRRIH